MEQRLSVVETRELAEAFNTPTFGADDTPRPEKGKGMLVLPEPIAIWDRPYADASGWTSIKLFIDPTARGWRFKVRGRNKDNERELVSNGPYDTVIEAESAGFAAYYEYDERQYQRKGKLVWRLWNDIWPLILLGLTFVGVGFACWLGWQAAAHIKPFGW